MLSLAIFVKHSIFVEMTANDFVTSLSERICARQILYGGLLLLLVVFFYFCYNLVACLFSVL